jgi:predicted dehydrogenase
MVNAAIVGLGWWGQVLVNAVQGRSERMRFSRGVALDPEAAAGFARQQGLRLSGRFEDVLADPSLDAIVLATPHSQHVGQIVQAAACGKAVFCEKPLAFTLREAERAIQACESAGVVLGLGHDKRWAPAVSRLAAMVHAGELGELLHLEGRYSNDFSSQGLTGAWRQSRSETPAGGLTGPGLHVLDAFLSMAGPAARVAGLLHERPQGELPADSVALLMALSNGATASLNSVRGVPDVFELQAYGTRGWARAESMTELSVAIKGEAPRKLELAPVDSVGLGLEAFATAVLGGPAFPIPRHQMLRTVRALEAALLAIEGGGWVDVAPETP